ncbi:MAG: GH92 family glycosyl hydrolase [Bacteroidia bacterium]|nr:GH92 family glycosyl hydrolase [Bacteroidia bacterium]
MMNRRNILILLAIISLAACKQATQERIIDYVNPFIGTDEDGHTFPGALVPFGMVQLSPDNGEHGYNWCSGYHYSSNKIAGFSHTHFSGTGAEDLSDISLFPIVNTEAAPNIIRSEFSHKEETATPGYYSVLLKTFNIKAELTATMHCGLHRYTFPESKKTSIKIDLGFGNGNEARVGHNGDLPLECYFKKINDSTVVGFRRSIGFVGERWIFFAAQTSKPFDDIVIFADSTRIKSNQEARAVMVSSYLSFPATKNGEQILVKVAISSANIEGAMEGLKEIRDWDFEAVKKNAGDAWERELSKIKVISADRAFLETFYTAAYHCYFAPFRFDDALGKYSGADKKIQEGKNIYTLNSLWDTYRAAAPLFTLTQTERLPDIINSYLEFYKQYGLLPSWELYFSEANVMPGYHAVPIIADAILKDIQGFDYNLALEAMIETSSQDIRESDFYRQYEYVPDELDPRQRGVTKPVEYAFDDWCIAQAAKKMNRLPEYDEFMKRSGYWKNVFDPATGFVRPKDSEGKWMLPFNPKESIGFQEGNAWIYTWYVPQDVDGLIHAMGGNDKFAQKLDALYDAPDAPYGEIKNHGFYGLSEFSNEPSHHVPYLYSYVGKPWQTAGKVNHILTKFYSNKPYGLCGNDDCGQMSAWYVMSSIGFYPVNPANGEYVFGSPLANRSEFKLSNGKHFVVKAENLSMQNIYIQKATLNGIPYSRSFIKHSDIMKGGELVFYMGGKPSETWGTRAEDLPGKINN